MNKTKFVTYLIMISFALVGIGSALYFLGVTPVKITEMVTNYSTLAILVLVICWIVAKVDDMLNIPLGTILLNSSTLVWTFILYVLYPDLSLDPIKHAISSSGFNVVTALLAAVVYNNLSLLIKQSKKIKELEGK